MKMKMTQAVLFASILLVSSASMAQSATEIGGDATINAKVDTNASMALGSGSEAKAQVATVENGTKIGGDLTINAEVDDNIALSVGADTKTCSHVGTIGTSCKDK